MEIVKIIHFTVEWPCLLIQEKGSFLHIVCGACHTWSPIKALRYEHNVFVNTVANNGDEHDLDVLLWGMEKKMKNRLGKKGSHLSKKKVF